MNEIRWFFNGEISHELEGWIEEFNFQKSNLRTDFYLIIPNNNLGIKIREGRFEIKLRKKSQDIQVGELISGVLEDWSIFSEKLLNSKIESFEGLNGHQISIQKTRWQLRYEMDQLILASKEVILEPSEYIDYGVIVEITTLLAENVQWWTIGFDFVGSFDTTQIKLILAHIFQQCPLKEEDLTKDRSMGYPEFIQKIQSSKQDQ